MKTILALMLCLAPAYATEQEVNFDGKRQNCNVRTVGAHDTIGGRCSFWDEVMVGISRLEPLTIKCARLIVTCDREEKITE